MCQFLFQKHAVRFWFLLHKTLPLINQAQTLEAAWVHAKSFQSCLTLGKPMDCSPLGSSVHGILQTRILEWGAISFSGHLPDPGIKLVSLVSPSLAGRFFTTSTTWLDLEAKLGKIKGKHVYSILGSGFLGILGRKGNPDCWTPFFICRVDTS